MNEGKRAEARAKWVDGRLDWISRRWGEEFARFVAWHAIQFVHLEAAETWAGIQWGFITPDGAQDLDELATLEDIRGERVELLGQMAQAHGM